MKHSSAASSDGNKLSEQKNAGEWEKNARLDPLFAILSSSHGRDGKWDVEQFFATGRTEIDRVFSHLAEIGERTCNSRREPFGAISEVVKVTRKHMLLQRNDRHRFRSLRRWSTASCSVLRRHEGRTADFSRSPVTLQSVGAPSRSISTSSSVGR